jgi:hypothetical protein
MHHITVAALAALILSHHCSFSSNENDYKMHPTCFGGEAKNSTFPGFISVQHTCTTG